VIFEIVERVEHIPSYTLYGVDMDVKHRTFYDVVRTSDRKVIKPHHDLLEALYYKNELERMLG